MSYKATVFQSIVLQPAVKSNYWVYIPGFELSVVRAEGTSLPLPQYNVLECNHKGRPFYFPGQKSMPGDWQVTFTEDVVGSVMFSLLNTVLTRQFNSGTAFSKFSTIVCTTLLNTPAPIPHCLYELEGCWIQKLNSLDLRADGAGDTQKIIANIKYDNIKNITLGAVAADPFNLEKL